MVRDLNTYIADLVETELAAFEGEFFWNKKAKRFEIFATIYAENKNHVPISDSDETVSSEDFIEFNDGITFYDENKAVDPNEFLACFPFAGKKGLPAGVVVAAIAYFKDILIDGQGKLEEFLADPEAEEFSLDFDRETYLNYLNEQDTSADWLSYPKF